MARGKAGRVPGVTIDRTAAPFVALAAVPAAVSAFAGPPTLTIALAAVPVAVALFFRDPERRPPDDPNWVLAPADGRVMHAGPAAPGQGPAGDWQQITIFLSVFDVHINRTPISGTVTHVEHLPGSFRAAFRADSWNNERSEIWIDHQGTTVVVRQVVGLLARRVVCRVQPGDRLRPGARIGLMKFGSRMDVFLPLTAELRIRRGDRVRAGETVIARLAPGAG